MATNTVGNLAVRSDEPSDAEIDRYIDSVLRAAGSTLRHYTMQKSIDDMRSAMRAAIVASRVVECDDLL